MIDLHDTVAKALSPGQRSCILNLSDTFQILGCSEPVANRLCSGTPGRPALVEEGGRKDGFRTFRLNSLGLTIRDILQESDHD